MHHNRIRPLAGRTVDRHRGLRLLHRARPRRACVGLRPWPRWSWVAGASLAMGGGIWSMHFIGMLAFDMAMPVAYGIGLTILSLPDRRRRHGRGIRLGQPAWPRVRGRPGERPDDGRRASRPCTTPAWPRCGCPATSPTASRRRVSVLIAVTAATVALWLTFRQNDVWQKAVAAAVMGLRSRACTTPAWRPRPSPRTRTGPHGPPVGVWLGQQNLALYVAGATFLILFLAMLASSVDQQRTHAACGPAKDVSAPPPRRWATSSGPTTPRARCVGRKPDWARFTGQTAGRVPGVRLGASHPSRRLSSRRVAPGARPWPIGAPSSSSIACAATTASTASSPSAPSRC